jgi:sulfide dehydrogenase cytochrome subunit
MSVSNRYFKEAWQWSLIGLLLLWAGSSGAVQTTEDQNNTESLVFNCFTCHGTDGKSPTAMPGLYGKSEAYVARKLSEFKAGKGHPTVMDRIAKGYSDEEIARIAKYFGEMK